MRCQAENCTAPTSPGSGSAQNGAHAIQGPSRGSKRADGPQLRKERWRRLGARRPSAVRVARRKLGMAHPCHAPVRVATGARFGKPCRRLSVRATARTRTTDNAATVAFGKTEAPCYNGASRGGAVVRHQVCCLPPGSRPFMMTTLTGLANSPLDTRRHARSPAVRSPPDGSADGQA